MRKNLTQLAAVLVMALPGSAQPKTMVALYKVQFGKMSEYIAALNTAVTPALDRLVDDGTIQAYGIAIDVVHTPNQPNLAAWFTAASYAGIQKADDGVMAAIAAHPDQARLLLEAADMNAHQDLLLEASTTKFGKVPDGTKPFVAFSYFQIKPGKESEFAKLGTKYYEPVYDKLLKDGAIYGYQVFTQAFHTEEPEGTWVVVTLPDMAALDTIDTTFQAKMKALTQDERSIMENSGREVTVDAAHRDYLMHAVAFRVK